MKRGTGQEKEKNRLTQGSMQGRRILILGDMAFIVIRLIGKKGGVSCIERTDQIAGRIRCRYKKKSKKAKYGDYFYYCFRRLGHRNSKRYIVLRVLLIQSLHKKQVIFGKMNI